MSKIITLEEYLSRKSIKKYLIEKSIIITVKKEKEFRLLQESFDWRKDLYDRTAIIIDMLYYDVNNYVQRMKRLKYYGIKINGTKYQYFLRCGKKGMEIEYNKVNNRKNTLTKEYWIKKGYSEEEATNKISNIQKKISSFSPISNGKAKEYSVRCKEYWVKKGYSKEEAIKKVKEVQANGSLENFQKRYGREEGFIKWQERQDKWQQTIKNKSEEEKRLINRKKSISIEGLIARGYSQEEAEAKYNELMKRIRTKSSKQANKLILLLNEKLKGHRIYAGILNNEKCFGNKKVDFYDETTGVVVEYYGNYWHANPELYYENDVIIHGLEKDILAKDIWKKDNERIEYLKNFKEIKLLLTIWEKDFIMNMNKTIENIVTIINNLGKDN